MIAWHLIMSTMSLNQDPFGSAAH